MGQVVPLLGQSDQVEDLGHLGGDHVLGPADDLEGEGHVLEDRLVGEEAEVLEDAADVAPQIGDPPLGQMADLLAGLPDAAGVGHLLAEQQADEGGLARARGTHQEHELALVDLDRTVLEGDRRALVGLRDVLEGDHESGLTVDARKVQYEVPIPGNATPTHHPNGSAPLTSTDAGPAANHADQSGRRRCSACRRSSASMNRSRSPSSTASTFPVSASLRWSFTSWYGAIT